MAKAIGKGGVVAVLGCLMSGMIVLARGGEAPRTIRTQAEAREPGKGPAPGQPASVARVDDPQARPAPGDALPDQQRRWNAGDIRVRETLEQPGKTWSLAFSPDGSLLAAGTLPDEDPGPAWIVIWETATWKRKAAVKVERMRIQWVAFVPNGREVVASGLDESRLVVYDLASGLVRDLVREETSGGLQSKPAYSPDGRFMIVATQQEGVRIWQVDGWLKVQDVFGFRERMLDLAVDPSQPWVGLRLQGRIYALDGSGLAWNISPVAMMPHGMVIPRGDFYTGPPMFRGHRVRGVEPSWAAKHLASAPDGRSVAFASLREDQSASIDVYDVRDEDRWSRKTRLDLGDKFDGLYSLAFTPDGLALVAGCSDRRIRAWDVETAKELPALDGHDGAVMELVFSPDGSTMASAGTMDKTIKVWSPSGDRPR
jgi:WD40 repeat protein